MKSFIKIAKRLKPYYKYLFIAIIGMLLLTAAQLSTPMITRQLLAMIEEGSESLETSAINFGILFTVLYILQAVGQYLKIYYTHVAAWSFVSDFRVKLYDHLQNLSMKYFSDKQTGQLMSRITTDTPNFEVLIAHAIPDMIVNILLLIGSTILLFCINVTLACFTVIFLPLAFLCVFIYSKKVRPMFKKSHEKIGDLNAVIQDNISGIKEIQAFNKQQSSLKDVENASNQHKKFVLKAIKSNAVFSPLILFSNNMGNVIVIIIGCILAYHNRMSASDIVAFMMFISYFYQPISSLGVIFENIHTATTAADRTFEILETESEVKEKSDALTLKNIQGNIEFKNVSFSYDNITPVLHDVSVRIKAGETLALVGPTGIGKTTFVNLIERFYDVNNGKILIDDIDVRDVTLSSLRDSISIVLQDIFLFHGTIAENIGYGVENASMEDIIYASKLANAHDFIIETDNGYNTLVGERGMKLSGGQKQRISIARAILRNSPILILDEATAAVDTKTERLIQNAIDSISKNKTVIIIAHRLSTVKKADKIAVLGDSGIEEYGTHDELMNMKGKYYSLVNLGEGFSEK